MAAAVLAAGVLLVRRHDLERANRDSEIVLDYQTVLDLAHSQGQSPEAVLQRLRLYGINSLAVSEWTLDDLIADGTARMYVGLEVQGAEPDLPARLDPAHVYLRFERAEDRAVLTRNLALSLGPGRTRELGERMLEVAADEPTLRLVGLGFLPDRLNALAQEGYRLWLRPENKSGADEARVEQQFQALDEIQGVSGLIFGGLPNEAVGYPDTLKETARQLELRGWRVGYIELAPAVQQKGISTVCHALPQLVVRVLAVPPAQQARLDPSAAVAMYSLAARERNIRLLYVRPYLTGVSEVGDLEETNQALFSELTGEVAGGAASTFPPVGPPSPALALLCGLVAAGVGAGAWLLVGQAWPVPLRPGLAGAVVLGLGTAASVALAVPPLPRMLVALLSSLVFPILSLVLHLPVMERIGRQRVLAQVMARSIGLTLSVTGLSLVGALLSASLLFETRFMLGLDPYRGVKLLSLGVPLAVLTFYLARLGGRREVIRVLNLDLKLWHTLVLGLLAGVAVFYVLRTGNVGAPGASSDAMDTERLLRRWLDVWLGVRPRFKEFVLGHPALLAAPVLLWLGWRRLIWLALLAAAVGQASLVDTFAHTHTPVVVSLVRTFNGWGLGMALGAGFAMALAAAGGVLNRRFPWLRLLLGGAEDDPAAKAAAPAPALESAGQASASPEEVPV